MVGKKYDQGKPRWDLIDFTILESVVRVITHGAEKYGDDNWLQVENGKERYFAATMRHITAHRRGEYLDPESAEPHLSHAICNLMFLLGLNNNEEE